MTSPFLSCLPGHPYFIDHNNETSTYEDPRERIAAEKEREAELGPLPRSWEMQYDDAGHPYFQKALPSNWSLDHDEEGHVCYINHQTEETSYERPLPEAHP